METQDTEQETPALLTGAEFEVLTVRMTEALAEVGVEWAVSAYRGEDGAYLLLHLNEDCDTSKRHALLLGTPAGFTVEMKEGGSSRKYDIFYASLDALFS